MTSTRAPASTPAGLVLAFLAGALAVPVFHQALLALLHASGIVPIAPFRLAPTRPFGIPEIVSSSLWGGVWGVLFALTLPRWFRDRGYWVAAAVAGGLVLTLVAMLVVWPLKVGGLPARPLGFLVIGFLLNAAWGLGWALFLDGFRRARSR
jgi:hypothetical protein